MAHIEDRWEKVVQGTRVRTDRYGKGERWRARYFDPNGQERARTFARKSDAEKFLAGVESDKSRGLYVDPSAGRITVGQYAATWQAAQVHRRTTEAPAYRPARPPNLLSFCVVSCRFRRSGGVRASVACPGLCRLILPDVTSFVTSE